MSEIPDKDALSVPRVVDSGGDGEQKHGHLDGEVISPDPQITKPIQSALDELSVTGVRAFGSNSNNILVPALFRQVEIDLKKAQSKQSETEEVFLEMKDELADKNTALQISEERRRSLKKVHIISGFIHVMAVAMLALSLATPDDGLTNIDIVLLCMAGTLLLAGLFTPLFFSGKEQ